MRGRFKLIVRKEEEQGWIPAKPWCVGLADESCAHAPLITFVRGKEAFLRTRTFYDEAGQVHDLPEPVYVRIGRLYPGDDWRRRGRKPKKKK